MPDEFGDAKNVSEVFINVEVGGGIEQFPASDFSASATADKDLVFGAGNKNPRGRTRGNIEYEWELSMEGHHAETFNELSVGGDNPEEDPEFDIVFTTEDEGEVYKLVDCEVEESEYSGSDGDAVEFNASGNALKMKSGL